MVLKSVMQKNNNDDLFNYMINLPVRNASVRFSAGINLVLSDLTVFQTLIDFSSKFFTCL